MKNTLIIVLTVSVLAIAALFANIVLGRDLTLDPKTTLEFNDEVTQASVHNAQAFLLDMESQKKAATILLDSPGGSIVDGVSLTNTLKNLKVDTICIVNGIAASMAAVTLQYCKERYATESSIVMFHEGSSTMGGNLNVIRTELDFINRMIQPMDEYVAKRIGLSYDSLKEKEKTEWWLVGAKEAKDNNVIDDIVTLHIPAPKKEAKKDELMPEFILPPLPSEVKKFDKNTDNYIKMLKTLKR